MTRKPTYEVPLTENGSLMHYAPANSSSFYTLHEWCEPFEFEATLQLDYTISGRSAKYVMWSAEDGRTFPMFVTDLIDLIKGSDNLLDGKVTAVWYTGKRGANYGIKFRRNVNAAE